MYGNVDTPGFINIPHYILFSIYHLAQYWNKRCIDDMVYMIFLWERWASAGFFIIGVFGYVTNLFMCILWCVTVTSGLIFEQMGGFGLFDKLIPHFAWEVYGLLSLFFISSI